MADAEKRREDEGPTGGAAADYVPRQELDSVTAADFAAYANVLIMDDEDYETRFMKDAFQRAHDRELAALANLALIRSERDERRMLLAKLELEQAMSPREVNRRLRTAEEEERAGSKKRSSGSGSGNGSGSGSGS